MHTFLVMARFMLKSVAAKLTPQTDLLSIDSLQSITSQVQVLAPPKRSFLNDYTMESHSTRALQERNLKFGQTGCLKHVSLHLIWDYVKRVAPVSNARFLI